MTSFQETKLELIEIRWEISSRKCMLAQKDISSFNFSYHAISSHNLITVCKKNLELTFLVRVFHHDDLEQVEQILTFRIIPLPYRPVQPFESLP